MALRSQGHWPADVERDKTRPTRQLHTLRVTWEGVMLLAGQAGFQKVSKSWGSDVHVFYSSELALISVSFIETQKRKGK